MSPDSRRDTLERLILARLALVEAEDPQAEVPIVELQRELGLDAAEALEALRALVARGYAEADLFPVNVWARITEEGRAYLAQRETPEPPVTPTPSD